ncbi:MAG: glycosyltransferase family 39 protein, partial [Chloroflexota bacterium]|nr:glycosyltransferase family 39 protein [Chloroflexota bacterium]
AGVKRGTQSGRLLSRQNRSGRERASVLVGIAPRGKWSAAVALLLLAFSLRTIALTQVPPRLHNDEVVEIQITETVANGRVGVFFPEDTGHETLYYYFAAPFLNILGNTPFAMRVPTVFMSMIGMCVVWSLTRRMLGTTEAMSALAGFAVVFWTVMSGRVISHVWMEVPMAALAAYCFWRARSSKGVRAVGLWVLSGLCLGLSINAYTAARVLPAVYVAFGLYTLLGNRTEWHHWWKGIAITLAVTLIVALPLALYLVRHPEADQLGFFDINRPLAEVRKANLGPVIGTSLSTLGMFAFVGDPLPYFDVPGRPIFEPVGALLFGAGLLIALRRWRQPEYAFAILWLFLSLAPGMLSQPAPSYTRTIGAQVVAFAFPGIAIAALLDLGRDKIVYAALILLLAGNLAWTAHSYFIVWPRLESVRFWHQSGLKAVADRLQTAPEGSPVAICVPEHLINEHDPWWKPAREHMRYLLDRPDLSVRYYNCMDSMIFMGSPARYAFPDTTSKDQLRQLPIYDRFLVHERPVLSTLPDGLGVIAHVDEMPDPSQHIGDAVSASVHSWGPEVGEESEGARLPVAFDGAQFLGYMLSTRSLTPGDTFSLTAYWRVTSSLPPGLAQFTHVVSAEGAIAAQEDRLAVDSSSLLPDDIFVQVHELRLPDSVRAGEYRLSIGLYTPSDGARLEIIQGGRSRGTQLWLEPIVVDK